MAQLDALLQFLVDQQGHELLIPSDDNFYITSTAGSHVLNRVMSLREIAGLVQEVLPDTLRGSWDARETVTFLRRVDAGEFRVSTEFQPEGLRVQLTRTPLQYVEGLLHRAREVNASDLLLNESVPAFTRREGILEQLTADAALPPGILADFLAGITLHDMTNAAGRPFLATVGTAGRVRCAYLPGADGPSLALHLLPETIETPERLPGTFRDLLCERTGLVLAAALPGQGLTRLLAGLLTLRANAAPTHIIAIEELPEIPLAVTSTLLTRYTPGPERTKAEAIRDALQMRPEVLFVDDLPDEAALTSALAAVRSGCQVVAGCRAGSVTEAVTRLIGMVPPSQRATLCAELAHSLRGALAQMLCRGTDGKLIAAREVLISTSASTEAIRENHLHDLTEGIRAVGFSLDDALLRFVAEEKLSPDIATGYAVNRKRFREHLAARQPKEPNRHS